MNAKLGRIYLSLDDLYDKANTFKNDNLMKTWALLTSDLKKAIDEDDDMTINEFYNNFENLMREKYTEVITK